MVEIRTTQNIISVFQTDIAPWQEQLVLHLLKEFPKILQVDLDFEDCDHVLRIESESNLAHEIESLLRYEGFTIKELED